MATPTTTLSFRCPPPTLDAIDKIGREYFPSDKASGCDRTKALFLIIQTGISALSNGEIQLPGNKAVRGGLSNDDILNIESLIESKIKQQLEYGDIGDAIAKSYSSAMGQLNGVLDEIQVLKTEIEELKPELQPQPELQPKPQPEPEPKPQPVKQNKAKKQPEPTIINDDDKAAIIGLLGIEKIVFEGTEYGAENKEIFALIVENKQEIESKLNIKIKNQNSHPVKDLNAILRALGYEIKDRQPTINGVRVTLYSVIK
jgi:transcription termination factor NusB